MRLPVEPCCYEHSHKNAAKWPSWDDMVVWTESSDEPLYKYWTRIGDEMYELSPVEPENFYSIFRMPKVGGEEKTLVTQIGHVGGDVRGKLAELRATLPIILRETAGGLLR